MTKVCSMMAVDHIAWICCGAVACSMCYFCDFAATVCFVFLNMFSLLSVVDICTCQVGLEIFQVLEDQRERGTK